MKLRLSLVAALACAAATSSFAADSLEAAFAKGKVSGNVQAWYINDSFQAGSGVTSTGSAANPKARGEGALGGTLSYVTDPYYGINAGATFISSNLMGQNPNAGNSTGYGSASSSTVSSINYNSNTLSEAYIQGAYGKTVAKVGEQKLVTPLADSNDGARIFYNTFKAGVLMNSDVPDTTLVAAYVNGMLTRSTSVYYPGAVSGSAGATNNAQASINLGYQGMDYVAFGGAANAVTGGQNNPVWALAAVNKSLPGLTAQAWFYQATNVLNAWYFQGDYAYKVNNQIGLFAGAQFLNEGGIGNTQTSFKNGVGGTGSTNALAAYCNGQGGTSTTCSAGIAANYFAFKVGGSYEDLTLTAAYSNTSYNANAAMDGSLIMPWGGAFTTLYTSSMTGNATAAGTQATQWKAEYKFDGVLKGLYAQASYTLYSAKNAAQDAYTTGNPFGYNATSGTNGNAVGGNMGYSATYGELKYDLNAQTQFRWRVESDNMIGQTANMPKSAMESRLMGIYKF